MPDTGGGGAVRSKMSPPLAGAKSGPRRLSLPVSQRAEDFSESALAAYCMPEGRAECETRNGDDGRETLQLYRSADGVGF